MPGFASIRLRATRLAAPLFALFVLFACAQRDDDARVKKVAAKRLGVAGSTLRVTRRTDLDSDRHRFYRVTRVSAGTGEAADASDALTVAITEGGAAIDSGQDHAFEDLIRDEDAGHTFTHLGPDRVAAWFGAFGGDACRPPLDDARGTATASHEANGDVTIRYRFASDTAGAVKQCVIVIGVDGSLRSATTHSARVAGDANVQSHG